MIMSEIVNYFENISSFHRSLMLVGGISFFWFVEGFFPLFKFRYKKWLHALPNMFFTITTVVINFSMAFLLLNTSDWTVNNKFGLLHWIPDLPLWTEVILGVFLLDLLEPTYPTIPNTELNPCG